MPNMPNLPPQMPTGAGNVPNSPNLPSGQERQNNQMRVASRSRTIRSATNSIITTRQSFKAFLNQFGMDIFTSATEFKENGDFINSSYIVYLQYGGQLEPLANFLQRYPQYQSQLQAINASLKPYQQQMQALDRQVF